MKVALVYDYLNQYGGGERVLEVLCGLFSEAPIFTIFYDGGKTNDVFANRQLKTSFLDFPLARKKHRLFIPLMPAAVSSIRLGNEFDLIISAGAGYGKGILCGPRTRHLSYCFTPLRYAWEDEYLPPYLKPAKFLISPVKNYLKNWDYNAAQRPDKIVAISRFIAEKINRYYHRPAEVIYPPLDEKRFFYDSGLKQQDYFLAAGRLLHYKKFDLVIEVFNKLKLPLKIVGIGPEAVKLNRMINSNNIEMLGFVSDEEIRKLYNQARGFIFPQVEDFGLVAAEAQACGCPVIAFAGGGALEIIENGATGLLFNEQSTAGLTAAVENFSRLKFNRDFIAQKAKRFSKDKFKEKFLLACKNLMKSL